MNAAIGVSFLIPAFNEATTIEAVLDRILALEPRRADHRRRRRLHGRHRRDRRALRRRARGHRGGASPGQPRQGRGGAGRDPAGPARHLGAARRRHGVRPRRHAPALIEPIERGVADAVYGSRLSGGAPQRAYLFWHLVGNRFLSLVTGVLYNTTLSDMETGYKAFRTDVLRSLTLTRDDFGIEPGCTGELCRRGMRIYQLPVAYYGRTYAEGKNITWRDGFRALRVLIEVRMRR